MTPPIPTPPPMIVVTGLPKFFGAHPAVSDLPRRA